MSTDKVSFQNGFICGMATKGLVRSGEQYKPTVWNDSGVYTYFYIDFRRAMEAFSMGMFNESILVYDSTQITVSQVDYVSVGVYKVWCDISNRLHGITVLNKKTSLLSFATGQQLPTFSTHFFVAGSTAYENMKYIYERLDLLSIYSTVSENEPTFDLSSTDISIESISENKTFSNPYSIITESTPTLVLI